VGIIRVLVQAGSHFNQDVTDKQKEKELSQAVFIVRRLTQTKAKLLILSSTPKNLLSRQKIILPIEKCPKPIL